MPVLVPLQLVPSQKLAVLLNSQPCDLRVYQRSTGLYVDVLLNDELVIGGVIAQDRNPIVRDAYLGFQGDLAFVDQLGNSDPAYTGLGSRWLLFYYSPDEVAAGLIAYIDALTPTPVFPTAPNPPNPVVPTFHSISYDVVVPFEWGPFNNVSVVYNIPNERVATGIRADRVVPIENQAAEREDIRIPLESR